MIFVATRNGWKEKKIFPSFGSVVGSEIRDLGWIKFRIWGDREKHHGPATLSSNHFRNFLVFQPASGNGIWHVSCRREYKGVGHK